MKRYEQVVDSVARRLGLQVSRISSHQDRFPVEATEEDKAIIRALRPFTMTSSERLWSLINAVRYVIAEDLSGDLAECGVWRGGSVMAMAGELARQSDTERQIWLFDTFAGMTAPTDMDVEAISGRMARAMLHETPVEAGDNVWCIAGRPDVEANVRSTGYPMSQFRFVEGDVAVTLQSQVPDALALLRLDTDWYESTRMSLEVLYPRLVIGGVCILDDYGHWLGARRAVDEYFAGTGHRPFMHPIDFSGRVFIKTQ